MALSRLIGTAPKMAYLSGQTLTGEVLLVDDTPGNRKITVATLRYMGLFPDEVINGEEAIKAVSNKHYDVSANGCSNAGDEWIRGHCARW